MVFSPLARAKDDINVPIALSAFRDKLGSYLRVWFLYTVRGGNVNGRSTSPVVIGVVTNISSA